MKLFKRKIRKTFSLDENGHFVSSVIGDETGSNLRGGFLEKIYDKLPKKTQEKLKKLMQDKRGTEKREVTIPSDIPTSGQRFRTLDELNAYYHETNPVGRSMN